MSHYSLKTLLSTFVTTKGEKRTIFNAAPLGGISSNVIKLFFILLPFIEYASIFNSYVFGKLGIATSIVFFIVFLSIVMIIIFLITIQVKRSVMKKIEKSWKYYFNEIDLADVLSARLTPYSDFFIFYKNAIEKNLNEDELYEYLKISFTTMQEENKELLNAMQRDKNKLQA